VTFVGAAYAEQLWAPDVPQELHEQIERHAKEALERYYHLGQPLAMPRLVETYGRRAPRAAAVASTAVVNLKPRPSRRPGPGRTGFDPWCLTDPATREQWQRDAAASEAIETLRGLDPAPQRTLAVPAAIDAALARGDVDCATDESG
jgi:hypothetical protein